MATTTPPSPTPPAAPPPRDPSPPRAVRTSRGRYGRPIAFGALAIVVLVVAYIVFAGGGGATYKLEFAEGDQLVRGDQVQVGDGGLDDVGPGTLPEDGQAVRLASVE